MTRKAYFAGGCFWCVTPTFAALGGVKQVVSGYSGGEEAPTYAEVKAQKTAHRETVAVEYDPDVIPFSALMDAFLANVDPFDGGGQFIDRGRSYTLAVYYTSDDERQIAESAIRALEATAGKTVFVALEPFRSFFPAEEEHQNFWQKQPEAFERELIESGRKPIPGKETPA